MIDKTGMRDGDMPLLERIEAARERIEHGYRALRSPAEATDIDIVLSDCSREISRLREDLRDMHSEFESASERAACAHELYVGATAERDIALAKIAAHNSAMDAECKESRGDTGSCFATGNQACGPCPRRRSIGVDSEER